MRIASVTLLFAVGLWVAHGEVRLGADPLELTVPASGLVSLERLR